MTKMVGIGYPLRLNHLDYIAEQGENIDLKTIYTKLNYFLQNDINGKSSRVKEATILLRVWHMVSPEYESLRERALCLFAKLSSSERLVLHWGMLLLTHPFFRDLTAELGNLFILQQEVPASQLYRKMRNLYGDKERVNVATKSVLATLRNMECIQSNQKTVYTQLEKKEIREKELKNWLTEVVIRVSGNNALPIDLISTAPCLYPFQVRINSTEIENPNLYILRQGLDMNMVCLK